MILVVCVDYQLNWLVLMRSEISKGWAPARSIYSFLLAVLWCHSWSKRPDESHCEIQFPILKQQHKTWALLCITVYRRKLCWYLKESSHPAFCSHPLDLKDQMNTGIFFSQWKIEKPTSKKPLDILLCRCSHILSPF